MINIFLLILIIFQMGCESNRFENWNEMKNKITKQESELKKLKETVYQRSINFSQLKEDFNSLKNGIDSMNQTSDKKIESHVYSVPFIPEIDKIDLSRLIGKKIGHYEIELQTIKDLQFTVVDKNIDFQLALSTNLFNTNNVSQNGLVSYYQYSNPNKGIINSTSSKLIIDAESPHLFLEGNKLYQISGKLVLKISGKF